MMKRRSAGIFVAAAGILFGVSLGLAGANGGAAPKPPASPVKLIFIHHSTGSAWLADYWGCLAIALCANNYFVSDTTYGWGPDAIGDLTDVGQWWNWFRGPRRDVYLDALYKESDPYEGYTRLSKDPGGENRIVLFKSCFPNSQISGEPDDPPREGANPLRGQISDSPYMTVANVKGIYNDLLAYFATRRDKLFILITSPPLVEAATDPAHAANARAVNDWLIREWLKPYVHNNVAVFDFYNVLTSNGGNAQTNDLGRLPGNHHRYRNGLAEHSQTVSSDMCAYGRSEEDSHPTAAGGKKASSEFVGLLNLYYARWNAGPKAPLAEAVTPSSGPAPAGRAVTFRTVWSDINGSDDLKECLFLTAGRTSPAATAYVLYRPLENKLYLRSQDGSRWLGGYAPKSAHTIENNQVRLNCAKTTVSAKSETITVAWNLTFAASYAGPKNLYLKATDKGRRTSGWKKKGAVTIALPLLH